MATPVTTENVTAFVRQKLEFLKGGTLFELNAPTYKAIKNRVDEKPITQKGYQISYWNRMPGGIGGFIPGNSSFNSYLSPNSKPMYVFPTYMAQPMIFDGSTFRMLNSGSESKVQNLGDSVQIHYDWFTKGLEWMAVGDGTGALAYSGSTITTLGTGQSLTGTTAAATTPGQTKGTFRLKAGQTYDSVNTSTEAVRGQFYIETEGASSCTIFLIWGSISSGDRITWPGSNQKMPRGLGFLISNASRVLQTISTATEPYLNSYGLDLAGNLLTPSTFSSLKAGIQTRANADAARNNLLCFMTPNQYQILARQGWNLTIQPVDETSGAAGKYKDGDTTFILGADMDEDRGYLAPADILGMYEEMPVGEFDLDGQTWRMLMGNNGTGSDSYQKAIGCAWNMGIERPIGAGFFKRALISSTQTQVAVNGG
jgi:hypothetical protein